MGTAELITPQIDTFEYRFLRLENNLQVVLVHDKDTDKAAAALDVSGRASGVNYLMRLAACMP